MIRTNPASKHKWRSLSKSGALQLVQLLLALLGAGLLSGCPAGGPKESSGQTGGEVELGVSGEADSTGGKVAPKQLTAEQMDALITGQAPAEVYRKLEERGTAFDTASLVSACRRGDGELVAYFTGAGFDLNQIDPKGEADLSCALISASRGGYPAIVEFLLKHGADIEIKDPLAQGTALYWAAANGNLEMLKLLEAHGAKLDAAEHTGLTPLHVAAMNNRPEIVRYLLERGQKVDQEAIGGLTPLHCASRSGSLECAQLLVEHGADVNKVGLNGLTPPLGATLTHHIELAKYFYSKGGKLDGLTDKGMGILHLVVRQNDPEVIGWLLSCGVNPDLAEPENGLTPLMLASINGSTNSVIALLKGGADPKIKDKRGNTAAVIARSKEQNSIADMIDNFEKNGDLPALPAPRGSGT